MIVISDLAVQKVRKDNIVVGRLMSLFDRTQNTIWKWFDEKDLRLTTPEAVNIISQETGLSRDEIITDELVES